MNLNRFYPLKALLLTVFLVFSFNSVQAADVGAKVVYHVDFKDTTRYSATLTSINNILSYYESELMEAEVHLVFVGFGIKFTTNNYLKGTPFEADKVLLERRDELKGRLQTLMKMHDVQVHLCDKTRTEVNLPKEEIFEGIQFVPSGVAKIAILQGDNFAYLKVQ